jgi:L-glutamine-phosphate cytidylyltransferase
MIAIILAAGVGSRLGNSLPKPLTELDNGLSILEWQISTLKKIGISRIMAVVGFKKELIMERFPDIMYLYNPDYQKENTSKSLLRALNVVDEDVLWLNGDVVFHPQAAKALLHQKTPVMLVNKTAVGEEEVKYRLDAAGKICEVAKKVKDPQGEAVGINFFPKNSLEILRKNLSLCKREDYFEYGVQLCIDQGLKIDPVFCKVAECIEIDFPEDLKKANALIASWGLNQ